MVPMDFLDSLPPPWKGISPGDAETLGDELARELAPGHPLHGVKTRAVARRIDTDDVLFALEGHAHEFACVHLTWSGAPEPAPSWPAATLYRDWDDWRRRGMLQDRGQ